MIYHSLQIGTVYPFDPKPRRTDVLGDTLRHLYLRLGLNNDLIGRWLRTLHESTSKS